jgi:hypothetical protein
MTLGETLEIPRGWGARADSVRAEMDFYLSELEKHRNRTSKKPTSPLFKEIRYEITDKGCCICTSHCRRNEYPAAMIGGKFQSIHRFLCELAHGELEEGMVVRHTCDNPACIRVSHLIPGTHADNVKDKMERGRGPTGEQNPLSKLKEVDVRRIRAYLDNGVGVAEIARKFGVDRCTIGDIKAGRTWGHIL